MGMDERKKDEFFKLCKTKFESAKLTVVGRDDVSFPSKIKFIDDTTIEFTMSRIKGMVPDVSAMDKLDVNGTLSTGQQLLFYAKVRRVNISDDPKIPSILYCSWPDDFAKKQMRQDVRVKCALKAYYGDQINESGVFEEGDFFTGVLGDVSRGGCFLMTKEKVYFRNSDIYLFLYLNEVGVKLETIIPCKVVVLKELTSKEPKVQGMALNFSNVSKDTEDKLVEWIFAKQREQAAAASRKR